MTIEFTQSGLDLMLNTDELVQFSRETPVQVTLTDDTFTAANNLSLNFIPEDGRTRQPARVELTQSATDSTVYTGAIGKAATLKAGLAAVSLSGIVTATEQVINSRAERVRIYRSVDPEAVSMPDSESLAGLIRAAVDDYAGSTVLQLARPRRKRHRSNRMRQILVHFRTRKWTRQLSCLLHIQMD